MISTVLLFAEPRVGKVWVRKLEEDARSLRNYRHALFADGWCSCKGCSGGAYIDIQNNGGMWPSEYIMMCVCGAINNLSCSIAMQSHCLQDVGREQEDGDGGGRGQERLTIAILANFYPSTGPKSCRGVFQEKWERALQVETCHHKCCEFYDRH